MCLGCAIKRAESLAKQPPSSHNNDYAKCEYCGKKNRVVGYCVTDGCTMHDGKHFA